MMDKKAPSHRLLQPWIEKRHSSILLLGPRQAGKSTFMQAQNPDFELNLAKESIFMELQGNPKRFEELLELHAKPNKIFFIDEIQRIPSLLNSLQDFIDRQKNAGGKNTKFLITGSSARKLKRGEANLLPGRILTAQMSGLCCSELNYAMDTEKALSRGTLPGIYFLENEPEAFELLETYASVYLKEEIQAETLTRNIAGFSRFMNTIAQVSGKILDISKIATKSKVARTSVVRFIEILEDTLIAERVMSCNKWEEFDVIRHPKLFLFDTGVWNGLIRNFTTSLDRKGVLFEALLYSQLRSSGFAKRKNVEIEYLRTRGGLEVDFVVTVDNEVFLIEAKSSSPENNEIKSIETVFEAKKKELAGAFVAVAENCLERKYNGVHILPWQKVMQAIGL